MEQTNVAVSPRSTAAYFARLRELVALELKEEQAAYRRSLEAKGGSMSGRICEPACRYPVTPGGTDYNALGQLTLQLRYEVEPDEVELDFEPGRPVTLFYLDGGGEAHEVHTQCYVETVGEGTMAVSLPGRSALQSVTDLAARHFLGVQLGVDNTSYRVMDEALREAPRREDERFARLRSVLLGQSKPAFRQLPRLSFPWLNASQQGAIQQVLEAQEVSIVHGPPGTGKTTTLVEAIVETLQRETQVLVCAPSNAAVDWISEQLMRRGIHVLRVGNPLRMSDEMLECSYERRYAAHPDYHELWSIRRALREAESGKRKVDGEKRRKMRERQTELEIKINADLFQQASVVSCTLIGSAYRLMDRRRFSTLFIDEAAQALEPACWAAILRADRVVMGGDHQQLPPTVKSLEASALRQTLMEKIVGLHPQAVTLLTTQYRMNKAIMAFPSRWFYNGELKAAPEAAERLVSPLDSPLMWLDTSALDYGERENRHRSRTNAEEARLVIHTLRDYIEAVAPIRVESERVDFGVITPYRGQARLLRRLLKMQHYFRRLRRAVTVGTVDGFQGQERDVIVISLVRDNAEGQIGFLRDLRRMNVAMTRARMKLIIVGNAETLGRHRFYRELAEHIRRHGDFVTLPPAEGITPPAAD